MADPSTVHAAIDRYLERFNAGDREGWLDLFAGDATLEDPVGTDVRTGREEIGGFWDFSHSLSDAVELQLLEPVKVSGDEAAFVMRIIATVGDARMAVDVIETQAYDAEGRITAMRAFWAMEDMAPFEG